jgi:hypothetical protein
LKDTGVDGSRPIIINWISREIVFGNVDWVYLAQDRDRKWAIEHSNKTSGSIKYRKYLDWLSVKLGSQGLFSIVSTECRFRVVNTLGPEIGYPDFFVGFSLTLGEFQDNTLKLGHDHFPPNLNYKKINEILSICLVSLVAGTSGLLL